ncbi:Ficolin-2 [Exaiptasia diaphana]|nr:Ficolin-2 [Exaiptasia diaphana]
MFPDCERVTKDVKKVYCDQKTAGGGWTVFQRRKDGSVDFYRGWNDYKNGFGDRYGESWLGLDKIHRLTKAIPNRLRVDLEDKQGKRAYAEYDKFTVSGESNKYKLSLASYSGTAGDLITYHNDMKFTTKDSDNDEYGGNNCAIVYEGAWWYKACYHSNLNGKYFLKGTNDGTFYGSSSLRGSEMKIKPV